MEVQQLLWSAEALSAVARRAKEDCFRFGYRSLLRSGKETRTCTLQGLWNPRQSKLCPPQSGSKLPHYATAYKSKGFALGPGVSI